MDGPGGLDRVLDNLGGGHQAAVQGGQDQEQGVAADQVPSSNL